MTRPVWGTLSLAADGDAMLPAECEMGEDAA